MVALVTIAPNTAKVVNWVFCCSKPTNKAPSVAPIPRADITQPYCSSPNCNEPRTYPTVLTRICAPATDITSCINKPNLTGRVLNNSDVPDLMEAQVLEFSLFAGWVTPSVFGRKNISKAATRKVAESIKNICLAPNQAAMIPATPGPRTPNNW